MSLGYLPGLVPEEYSAVWLQEELQRLSGLLESLGMQNLTLVPQAVAPYRVDEGYVANADGTNWDPGGGAGLYQYLGGTWVKL